MKIKLITFCLLALALNACKSELPVSESGSGRIIVKNQDDVTIYKFLIGNDTTYVKEVGGKYFYAEDIIISPEQFNYLKKMTLSGLATKERSLIVSQFIKTWPDGIVYYTMPNQAEWADDEYGIFVDNIKKAFNMISSGTNILFIERTNQSVYLQFKKSNSNFTDLGYTNGVNLVNIYNYNSPGIIAHEIMHSLGVDHEQARSDRGQYIYVYPDRVREFYKSALNVNSTALPYGPFDFNSIMLYGSTSSANIDQNLPFMTKLDGTAFEGQRDSLSAGDYAGLNQLYKLARGGTFTVSPNLADEQNMDIAESTASEGAAIVLAPKEIKNSQKFILRKLDGVWVLKSKLDSTKVITIDADKKLKLRTLTNATNQKWILTNQADKGFGFTALYGASIGIFGGATYYYSLEVKGNEFIAGNISTGNGQQNFKLTKVD